MHLTLQLDWFPKGGGAVQQSTDAGRLGALLPDRRHGASDLIQNSLGGSRDTGVALDPTHGHGHGRDAHRRHRQHGPTDAATGNDSVTPTSTAVADATTSVTTTITAPAEPTVPSRPRHRAARRRPDDRDQRCDHVPAGELIVGRAVDTPRRTGAPDRAG